MTFTSPPAARRAGAMAAAQMAVQRTVLVERCVCRHERAEHVNRARCLFCDCREFTIPEPEPTETSDDLGT